MIINSSFASSITVVSSDGMKILAASRKENQETYGFPGGKRDAGETAVAAAVRELHEETGAMLTEDDLDISYMAIDEHNHLNINFVFINKNNLNFRKMEPEVEITWMSPDDFLKVSAFPGFSKCVFDILSHLRIIPELR